MGGKYDVGNIPTEEKNETLEQISNEADFRNGKHPLEEKIIKGKNKPFTIGNMPECLIEIYKKEASKKQMSLREYLTHLMKISGVDVPDIRFLNPNRRLK